MRRLAEISKIRSFVPGGARGVQLKSKVPLSCASVESRGLIIDGQRRFKVRVVWERTLSQRCSGKTGSQLVMPEIRWSLKVYMARWAEFVLCRCGGYKLKRDSLAEHIILEAGWTFIVEHLELGAKAPIGELGVEDGVGSDDL